jgi:retinol dehydrogenase-14
VILDNAGNFSPRFETTEDGLESHMAIHVLGTFLLTTGLSDILRGGRVINVTSSASYIVSHFDLRAFCDANQFSRQGGYSNAKYAQTLLTLQFALNLREQDIAVNCVHPGMVNTDIIRSDALGKAVLRGVVNTIAPFVMLTPKQGALTPIWAALSPECDSVTGRFFSDLQEDPFSWKITDDFKHGHGKALLVYCENLVKKVK